MYNNRSKKCKCIIFRVTPEERELIENYAYKHNLTISNFVLSEIKKTISSNDSFL